MYHLWINYQEFGNDKGCKGKIRMKRVKAIVFTAYLFIFLSGIVWAKEYPDSYSHIKPLPIPEGIYKKVKSPKHPFLYFNSKDIRRLRKQAGTTHKKYLEHLKGWAEVFGKEGPVETDGFPTQGLMTYYFENGASYIVNMSVLYHATGDETYAEIAKKWLLTFSSYPTRSTPDRTLNGYWIGAYILSLSSGYDMLYPLLSRADRKKIVDHIAALVELGCNQIYDTKIWWAGINLHHDQWIPVALIGLGAVTIYDEVPEAHKWLSRCIDQVKYNLDLIYDGGWPEGVACWCYNMAPTFMFAEALKNLGMENLFEHSALRNATEYRLYNWLRGNNNYIYHSDSHLYGRYGPIGGASCHLMRKLAAEYQDGYAQWLADQDEPFDVAYFKDPKPLPENWQFGGPYSFRIHPCAGWNFLWYDPVVKPKSPDDLPLHRYFPNLGLIIVRSGWDEKDVVFTFNAGPIGGHKGYKRIMEGDERLALSIFHIHPLNNDFNLYVNGNYLAVPPGYGAIASEFHNTLTVDGSTQFWHPKYKSEMRIHDFQDDYAYFVGDGTDSYPESFNLDRWFRHVAYFPPNVFIMCDELVTTDRLSKYQRIYKWNLNINPRVNEDKIDGGNLTITIAPKSGTDTGAMSVQFFPSDPGDRLNFEKSVTMQQTSEYRVRRLSAWMRSRLIDPENHECDPSREFLAVITALEDPTQKPPSARSLQINEDCLGVVVDSDTESNAAVFSLHDSGQGDDFEVSMGMPAMKNLTCLLFSLMPNTGYRVTTSTRPDDEGLTLHTIVVTKGGTVRSNSAGTLVIKSEGK